MNINELITLIVNNSLEADSYLKSLTIDERLKNIGNIFDSAPLKKEIKYFLRENFKKELLCMQQTIYNTTHEVFNSSIFFEKAVELYNIKKHEKLQ
jgi:hypothetical protein